MAKKEFISLNQAGLCLVGLCFAICYMVMALPVAFYNIIKDFDTIIASNDSVFITLQLIK